MAAYNRFNIFSEDLGRRKHDLGSDILKIALCTNAPVAANQVLADITSQLVQNPSYPAGGFDLSGQTYAQTAGVSKLIIPDYLIEALSTSIGPFRYIVLYNSSALNNALIGWYDCGVSKTIGIGKNLLVDFDGAAGVLTVG